MSNGNTQAIAMTIPSTRCIQLVIDEKQLQIGSIINPKKSSALKHVKSKGFLKLIWKLILLFPWYSTAKIDTATKYQKTYLNLGSLISLNTKNMVICNLIIFQTAICRLFHSYPLLAVKQLKAMIRLLTNQSTLYSTKFLLLRFYSFFQINTTRMKTEREKTYPTICSVISMQPSRQRRKSVRWTLVRWYPWQTCRTRLKQTQKKMQPGWQILLNSCIYSYPAHIRMKSNSYFFQSCCSRKSIWMLPFMRRKDLEIEEHFMLSGIDTTCSRSTLADSTMKFRVIFYCTLSQYSSRAEYLQAVLVLKYTTKALFALMMSTCPYDILSGRVPKQVESSAAISLGKIKVLSISI